MNCPKCNGRVSIQNEQCPFCGMDLMIYRKIFKLSNAYYNDGLKKAQVRDLSGAIVALKKSLELNKKNTEARNLLGLVYFEMGETVAALSSWVISKHLQPENNEADRYMRAIQKNANKLEAMNQTIKKYNIALQSAQSGNYDLAMLQLKKVTAMNPHYVNALQLLAVLLLRNGEVEKARRYLLRAKKIDVANTRTLSYLQEIESASGEELQPKRENLSEESQEARHKVIETNPNVAFMPVSSYREEKPNVRAWINLVIGVVIGVACGYFLFVPAAERAVHQKYKAESSDISSKISVYSAQITSLEKDKKGLEEEVAQLRKQLDSIVIPEYDEKMYDDLFKAFHLYVEEQNKLERDREYEKVASLLLKVKDSALENEAAKKIYNTLKDATFEPVAKQLYEKGHNQYSSRKFEDALQTLLESYQYNSKDPSTIYFIGRAYEQLGEPEKAKKYYNKIIKDFEDTSRYNDAKIRLNQIGN